MKIKKIVLDCPIVGHEWRTTNKEEKSVKNEPLSFSSREIELLIYAVDKKINAYNNIINKEGDESFAEDIIPVRDEYVDLFYKLK